jgi:hypothetical protein
VGEKHCFVVVNDEWKCEGLLSPPAGYGGLCEGFICRGQGATCPRSSTFLRQQVSGLPIAPQLGAGYPPVLSCPRGMICGARMATHWPVRSHDENPGSST